MKIFATELAAFLRRHYPEANKDGAFRFSADIQIRNGMVDVDIPILTRLPAADPLPRAPEQGEIGPA